MKHWFSNLKFRYKLLIGMIAITTLALLLIIQLSYFYFYRRNTNEVMKKSELSVEMAGATFTNQFQTLSTATNHLLVRPPFPDMIADITGGNFSGYSKYYSEATDETASFLQNHIQLNNMIICGEDGFLFSPNALGISGSFEKLFTENIWDYPGITVFPTRHNSLFKQGGAIPISYPVFYSPGDRNLTYRDVEGTAKARVIILMDTSQIRSYFHQMSNSYTYCMYLADENGVPLDIIRDNYPDAFDPQLEALVADKENKENLNGTRLAIEDDELVVSTSSVRFCGLTVVHLSKRSSLTGDIKELQSFFLLIWLACTLISVLLALGLSNLLTRNVKLLGSIIGKINNRTYTEKVIFPHSDEISVLGTQLNQMYDTIQLQLQQIKEEEQKKAQAEIQMMSEQINPHFLYNTLECIHFQVLNNHTDTAGGMLESLGRYLRITLSVGQTFISVEKEVEHVASYLKIMNRNSSNGVRFSYHIDPELKSHKIIKAILQPLAENSMKHGFQDTILDTWPVPPQITISITRESEMDSGKGSKNVPMEQIIIEVSDNGKGIDIEKATNIIHEDNQEGKKHFGLRNIYRRLKACYGDRAEISFISIPYLKNSVIITIPYNVIDSK
jgi:sensor histidine kinase YesM